MKVLQRIPGMHLYLYAAPLFAALTCCAAAPASFAVASIRPSAKEVKFERDGKTELSPGAVTMRDVTVATCIKWAYGVQDSQISGPAWLQWEHFDIMAKADEPVGSDELKGMMQSLLADRFQLVFHRQNKDLRSYAMTVAKSGAKVRPSASDTKPSRENTAVGTVVRATTMAEFANFMAGPLETPVVDMTGMPGKYDFDLDFTNYLPEHERVMKMEFENATGIIIEAMQGELGLKLESRKETVEVMVVDRVERPSAN
jgi:uncharacterized protein (TIGR03435 family)